MTRLLDPRHIVLAIGFAVLAQMGAFTLVLN